jgi:2-hydroxychromene-2-carboxylate isomerase
MSLIVYADFSSPECYLASRRAAALHAAGVDVDWRAVEHEPGLPVGGRRVTGDEHDRLSATLAELGEMLLPAETLPWVMPRLVPKTEAAVSTYAESYGLGVDDDVRRLLFELYWLEGADIGNPNVLRTPLAGPILRANSNDDPLRESGYAVSVDRGPITTAAYRHIHSWRAEWMELGSSDLPIVITGGATLTGIEAVRRLGKEIVYTAATAEPELDDPRRYPPVAVRPQPAWVSQIGGRWRHAYKLTGAS